MKIAQICYAKPEHRSLCDDTAHDELMSLGFAKAPKRHGYYYVTDARVEEIQSVIFDLNKLFKGSLWIWWWDDEAPNAPGVRWYPPEENQ